MFEYTSLAIMAGEGGATVKIDADANGIFETTVTPERGAELLRERRRQCGRTGRLRQPRAGGHPHRRHRHPTTRAAIPRCCRSTCGRAATMTPVSTPSHGPEHRRDRHDGVAVQSRRHGISPSSITTRDGRREPDDNAAHGPGRPGRRLSAANHPRRVRRAISTATWAPFYAFSTTNSTDSQSPAATRPGTGASRSSPRTR